MNPKHKDRVSICNDTLPALTCYSPGSKYVNSVSVYFSLDKNIYAIDFHCYLPNDGKQKQVKATEVYLLWIFCKKKTSSYR